MGGWGFRLLIVLSNAVGSLKTKMEWQWLVVK